MNEHARKKAVSAIRRIIGAAKELAAAERALKRPRRQAQREQAAPNADGNRHGQDAQGVHRG